MKLLLCVLQSWKEREREKKQQKDVYCFCCFHPCAIFSFLFSCPRFWQCILCVFLWFIARFPPSKKTQYNGNFKKFCGSTSFSGNIKRYISSINNNKKKQQWTVSLDSLSYTFSYPHEQKEKIKYEDFYPTIASHFLMWRQFIYAGTLKEQMMHAHTHTPFAVLPDNEQWALLQIESMLCFSFIQNYITHKCSTSWDDHHLFRVFVLFRGNHDLNLFMLLQK